MPAPNQAPEKLEWQIYVGPDVVDEARTPTMAITLALAARGDVVDRDTGECMWLPDGTGTWQTPPRVPFYMEGA